MVIEILNKKEYDMNRIAKLLLISAFIGNVLYAQKPDSDKFFYDKGYRDGKVQGMRIGYDKAKKEIMRKLKSRLTSIKAMEAGKYLSRKHRITAPQIYQVRRADGSLSVQIKGCRLEAELTPEEIMLLPSYTEYADKISNAGGLLPSSVDVENDQKGVSDGVFLPGIDSTRQSNPKMASSMIGAVYKYLPNTEFYIRLLRTSGFPFTITNGGINIKVRFESEHQAITFMKRYALEPGRDVK